MRQALQYHVEGHQRRCTSAYCYPCLKLHRSRPEEGGKNVLVENRLKQRRNLWKLMVKIKTTKRIHLVHAYKASKDEYTYLWKYIHLFRYTYRYSNFRSQQNPIDPTHAPTNLLTKLIPKLRPSLLQELSLSLFLKALTLPENNRQAMQPRVISATLLVKIHHQCSSTFDTHLFGPSESLAAWLVRFPLPHPTIETAWRNLVFAKNWSTEGPFSVLLAHFQFFFSQPSYRSTWSRSFHDS